MGAQSDTRYKVDAMPPTRYFEAGEDNRNDLLHPASFQPRPICSEEEIYELVPIRIEHIYKNLPLHICGADAQVAERTIGLMHDRTVPVHIKYFFKGNAAVTYQPMVEERRRSNLDGVSSVLDYDWVDIDGMTGLRDALINFSLILQFLFPVDLTGNMLQKLYNQYQYLPYGSEKDRIRVISDHFNRASQSNIGRAARGRPPLDFQGLENLLKAVLQAEGWPREPPCKIHSDRKALEVLTANLQATQVNSRGKGRGRGGPAGTGAGANRGQGPRPGGAGGGRTPTGKAICFSFNDGQCTRPKTATGCTGGKGNKEFLHCCNAWSRQTNSMCMMQHPKWQHV